MMADVNCWPHPMFTVLYLVHFCNSLSGNPFHRESVDAVSPDMIALVKLLKESRLHKLSLEKCGLTHKGRWMATSVFVWLSAWFHYLVFVRE
jgi:hypothetical protein